MARPQLSPEAVDAMRQRLVDAALAIYRAKGLDAVSFRGLADAVGLSHTLAYRYFADKDALLAALRVDCTHRFERYVRRNEHVDAPVAARIRSVANAYVGFAREHADEYLLIFSTTQPPPSTYPELLAARRSLFEHAVGVVKQGIEDGSLRGDARQVAHAFWVSLHGLMSLHAANQLVHGLSLEQLVEPIIDGLLGASRRADPLPVHTTRRSRTPRAARPSR